MISKDLFKSHPIPFQAAFRTDPRHLFHFCVICIFKGYKLNEAAKDTDLHLRIRCLPSFAMPLSPDDYTHLINTQPHTCQRAWVTADTQLKVQLFTLHARIRPVRMCATHPPEKMGLINIFLGILLPQVCLVTLTYTQISAVLAIYSAVAAASISDTGFTMIYEPAHWPSLFWKEKRGHISSYMRHIHPMEPARSQFLRAWEEE